MNNYQIIDLKTNSFPHLKSIIGFLYPSLKCSEHNQNNVMFMEMNENSVYTKKSEDLSMRTEDPDCTVGVFFPSVFPFQTKTFAGS